MKRGCDGSGGLNDHMLMMLLVCRGVGEFDRDAVYRCIQPLTSSSSSTLRLSSSMMVGRELCTVEEEGVRLLRDLPSLTSTL